MNQDMEERGSDIDMTEMGQRSNSPNSPMNGGVKSSITSVDYVEFWVGNAKVSSKYYCSAFGFTPLASKCTFHV